MRNYFFEISLSKIEESRICPSYQSFSTLPTEDHMCLAYVVLRTFCTVEGKTSRSPPPIIFLSPAKTTKTKKSKNLYKTTDQPQAIVSDWSLEHCQFVLALRKGQDRRLSPSSAALLPFVENCLQVGKSGISH